MKQAYCLCLLSAGLALAIIGCGSINPFSVPSDPGAASIAPIGNSWVQATGTFFSGRSGHRMLSYNNKLWVITGTLGGSTFANDVWSSTTGSNWTQVTASAFTTPGRLHSGAAVFNGKMWVSGGLIEGSAAHTNDVWYSTDGSSWTKTGYAATPRNGHTLLSYDNKLWLIGGILPSGVTTNDVWYSSDGTSWNCATAVAGFSKRYFHSAVVFQNKMWVIVGNDGVSSLHDAWYSTDGVTWTQASVPSFSARYVTLALALGERLYVMGGFNGSYLNDVYYTTDGNNWTSQTMTVPFTARSARAGTEFNSKLWVCGGNIGAGQYSDVWSSGN